jgi:hypothetical protein
MSDDPSAIMIVLMRRVRYVWQSDGGLRSKSKEASPSHSSDTAKRKSRAVARRTAEPILFARSFPISESRPTTCHVGQLDRAQVCSPERSNQHSCTSTRMQKPETRLDRERQHKALYIYYRKETMVKMGIMDKQRPGIAGNLHAPGRARLRRHFIRHRQVAGKLNPGLKSGLSLVIL